MRLRAVAASPAGMLDRLLRGRAWVACIGALLAGIVFLNVSLLEVNGGIASVSERAAALKRENGELQLRVAELASSERIQAAAAERGFALPEPAGITYLEAKPGSDGRRAARALERRGEVAQVAPPLPASGQPATPSDATAPAPVQPTPTPPVAGAPAAPASDG